MTSREIVDALHRCGQSGIELCDGNLKNTIARCAGCVNEKKMTQSNARCCFETWIAAADLIKRLEKENSELKNKIANLKNGEGA